MVINRATTVSFQQKGFTLVELVMVLMLMGIISALGVGLLADRRGFSVFTVRDGLMEAALLAQQRALANSASSTPIRLQITQQSQAWVVQVQPGATPAPEAIHQRNLERFDARLRVDGSLLADGATLVIPFDALGRTNVQRQLRVEGESSFEVCLAASGMAFAGTCPP